MLHNFVLRFSQMKPFYFSPTRKKVHPNVRPEIKKKQCYVIINMDLGTGSEEVYRVCTADMDSWTPLHAAAANGLTQMVR
jgi:hypothetical protein